MSLKTLRTEDGVAFRDLNHNGRMEPYEDPRLPLDQRVEDLLSRMTLEEKCGLMFHTMLAPNPDGSLMEGQGRYGPMSTSGMVVDKSMSHFNVLASPPPRIMAEWHNRLQEL